MLLRGRAGGGSRYAFYIELRNGKTIPLFFGKSKRGAGIEFLAFVLFFAVTMLLNVFIDIPILTGLSSYVMLVLIAFFGYESGWKQGLLYSVFAFVSMTLAECIV